MRADSPASAQAPLQPLMDNLESQTYETFERDPVKYARYEDAVHAALVDFPEDRVPVVMVVRTSRAWLPASAVLVQPDSVTLWSGGRRTWPAGACSVERGLAGGTRRAGVRSGEESECDHHVREPATA